MIPVPQVEIATHPHEPTWEDIQRQLLAMELPNEKDAVALLILFLQYVSQYAMTCSRGIYLI